MATYQERLQSIFHKYEAETGEQFATTSDVVAWAVKSGLLVAPPVDPYAKLAEEMSAALRAEYKIDPLGRKYRVNHNVRERHGGVQYSIWSTGENAPRGFMVKSVAQRRKGIAADCVSLKNDVDVYNDSKPHQEPIPLHLDFTHDVEEAQALMLEESEPG
ncbi:hypothetical protein [Nevskia sp.]|uniref:hypothetical protein n=1 Tax=Nevskia sp. TaxID=1929292 RepID=UPI003F710816